MVVKKLLEDFWQGSGYLGKLKGSPHASRAHTSPLCNLPPRQALGSKLRHLIPGEHRLRPSDRSSTSSPSCFALCIPARTRSVMRTRSCLATELGASNFAVELQLGLLTGLGEGSGGTTYGHGREGNIVARQHRNQSNREDQKDSVAGVMRSGIHSVLGLW